MRRIRVVTALGVLSLLAAACGGGGTAGTKPVEGGTFTLAIGADPGALDPAQALRTATNIVLSFAYDTLVSADAAGKVVPALAETWDVRPDAVTFTLRKGVTCSDGSPLTPADVAESINHIADPATKSPLYGVLVPPGMKAKADAAAGTVTLSTPEPFSFILQSTQALFIVCGKGAKDRSLLAHGTSGSGPYTLVEAVPSDHYTFAVRKDYAWGPGGATTKEPGQPAKVVFKVVPNAQTAANLLISGGVNAADISETDRARVEAVPGIGKVIQSAGNSQFFYHQGDDRPTKDVRVRKALTQAINLPELAKIASGGTGRPPTGLVADPQPCPGDPYAGHLPAFDPAAAAAGLEAAGWKPGPDGIRVKDGKKLSLRLMYATETGSASAEYQSAAWKKAGADVVLKGVSDSALGESLSVTQDWDVIWLGITVSLPSQLVGFLSGPPAPKGANFAHLANTRYEELVAKAARTPGAEGCKLWLESESALFDHVDLVPVVANTVLVATKGATFTMIGGIYPATIRMTEGG